MIEFILWAEPEISPGRSILEATAAEFSLRIPFLLVVAASWPLATTSAADDPIKQEMKRLQGRWVAEYVEIEGKPLPKEGLDDLKNLEIIVESDSVFLKENGAIKEGWKVTYRIDPTKNPKTIDISISLENFKPKTTLGIYRFDGKCLQICSVAPSNESERPTTFSTKPGSKNRLWQFKQK